MRSSVVLPLPLGPEHRDDLAGRDVEVDRGQRVGRPPKDLVTPTSSMAAVTRGGA